MRAAGVPVAVAAPGAIAGGPGVRQPEAGAGSGRGTGAGTGLGAGTGAGTVARAGAGTVLGAGTGPGTGGDWTLAGTFGAETWHRDADRFSRIETGGERIVLPADPVTLDRLRVRAARCPHAGPFPLAFRFCPECGAALADPPSPQVAESWSPPFGSADGLPEIAEPRAPDPAGRQEIVLPASSALSLAVAGTPPMLLACDRVTGMVSAWSERGAAWVERTQVPQCLDLPGWSWSASADAAGLTLPTDRGAAWLDLRAPRTVPVVQADRAIPLGGAIALRGPSMVPVRTASGMAIALLDRDAGGWTVVPVPGAPQVPSRKLGAPVAAAGHAFWSGQDGLLTARQGLDGVEARWTSREGGAVPLPGVRPVLERNGQPFQLARLDPRTLVLENLCVAGEVRVSPGYVLSSGRAVFREGARMRLPWEDRDAAEYPVPDGCFLLPLLSLGDGRMLLAVCTDRDRLGGFVGDPQADAARPEHVCTLFYSRGPRTLQPLDCVLRARSSWELSACIHAGWLYAHGALENRCHRWPLTDAH